MLCSSYHYFHRFLYSIQWLITIFLKLLEVDYYWIFFNIVHFQIHLYLKINQMLGSLGQLFHLWNVTGWPVNMENSGSCETCKLQCNATHSIISWERKRGVWCFKIHTQTILNFFCYTAAKWLFSQILYKTQSKLPFCFLIKKRLMGEI